MKTRVDITTRPGDAAEPVGVPSRYETTDDQGGRRVTAWERLAFSATHLATRFLLATIGLGGLYAFGRFFGTLEWVINYKRRARFAEAFTEVLGRSPTRSECRRTTREYFCRTRCDKLFYLILDCLSREQAVKLFSIEHKGLLDEAMSRGRGAYIALSHHGPHHVAATLMALLGYRVAGVRDRREGGLRRYMQERLARRFPEFRSLRMLFADTYPRDIYRCYQEGYVLGSAMDVTRVRLPHQKYEEVEIFGTVRPFLSGPMRIAIRSGAPVLQGFLVSDPGFRYRLDLTGWLVDPEEVQDESAAVAEAMRVYARQVEAYVRRTPALITRVG